MLLKNVAMVRGQVWESGRSWWTQRRTSRAGRRTKGGAFELKPSKRNIKLMTANGGEMQHYGEKEITFMNDDQVVGMKFQVTDVKKPLLAVRRLVEKGNVVSFGPRAGDNYIKNVETGRVIPMEKKGGSFVIKAHFVKAAENIETGFQRQVR